MSWISELFSSSVGSVVDSIGKAIDNNTTNDEERLTLRNELVKIQAEAAAKAGELEAKFEQELTNRHAADMASDSWLSKNIRPLALVFLLGTVSVLALFDGNIGEFAVGDSYVELYRQLLLLAFGFYFGSRGIEKVVKVWKK